MPASRLCLRLCLYLACCICVAPGVVVAAEPAVDAGVLLERGFDEVSRFRWKEAEPIFAQVRDTSEPGSADWCQATYAWAECAHHQVPSSAELVALARTRHQELFERGSTTGRREAGMAAIQLGRIAHLVDFFQDQPDLPLARTWYGKAIAGWGDDQLAGQAVIYLAQSHAEDLTPAGIAEAQRLLVEWTAAHPADPLVAMQWYLLGELRHRYSQDPAGAYAAFAQAESGVPTPQHWGLVWRMAMIAKEELHDRDRAAAGFRRIISEFPTSARGTVAQDQLRDLGIEPPPLNPNLWSTIAATGDAPGSTTPAARGQGAAP